MATRHSCGIFSPETSEKPEVQLLWLRCISGPSGMGTIDALRSIAEQPRHPDMTPDSENGDVGEEHSHRSHAAAVVVFGRGPVQVATSPLRPLSNLLYFEFFQPTFDRLNYISIPEKKGKVKPTLSTQLGSGSLPSPDQTTRRQLCLNLLFREKSNDRGDGIRCTCPLAHSSQQISKGKGSLRLSEPA